MNWRTSPELIASVIGSAVHTFYRPQKNLPLTAVNFIIGVGVSAVLSPAINDFLGIKAESFRSVISFAVGLLAMVILPAIIGQVEKRKDSIAGRVIDTALNLKQNEGERQKLENPEEKGEQGQ